jgi:Flp pilus assembly protein TadG
MPGLGVPWAGVRRLLRDRRGGAAVEFAVTISAFLVFLIGIVEFGRALWTDNALQFAADQAGRYVIVNPAATDDEIAGYAAGQLASVNPGEVTIAVSREAVNGVTFVTVSARYDFAPVTGLIPVGVITLRGAARVPLTV